MATKTPARGRGSRIAREGSEDVGPVDRGWFFWLYTCYPTCNTSGTKRVLERKEKTKYEGFA